MASSAFTRFRVLVFTADGDLPQQHGCIRADLWVAGLVGTPLTTAVTTAAATSHPISVLEHYAEFATRTLVAMQAAGDGPVTTSRDVAEAVYRSATDPTCPMMLPAGPDAVA